MGLDHLGDHARIGERKIGPEHHPLRRGDVIERTEGLLPGRERVVVPEVPQPGEDLLARQLRQPLVDHRRDRKPPGEIGHQPAGMGQNELHARKARDRPGKNQVHHRARGVEQIFHHEGRPGQREILARWVQAGMDEHDRAALVQHRQHGIEARVAEKILAVARKQRDAVELQHIERICDLVESALHGPHRDGGECAEAPGPARGELGRVVVAAARQRLRLGLAAEADAGLRQRGERDLDAAGIHQIQCELRGPVRVLADRGAPARRIDRLAVEWRNEVEMNVDPARRCHPDPNQRLSCPRSRGRHMPEHICVHDCASRLVQ